MPQLVLASGAAHRRDLLTRLGVPFTTCSADIDERAVESTLGEASPERVASTLAEAKARAVEGSLADADTWVLGVDQVAECEGVRLHKPADLDAALDTLMRLRGKTHRLVNGLALVCGAKRHVAVDERRITMRNYGEAEARAYVEAARPLGSVAAYHLEDQGIGLMAAIEGGDDSGVIGLPLLVVAELLRQAGLLPVD